MRPDSFLTLLFRAAVVVIAATPCAHAVDVSSDNVFVQALLQGQAGAPLPSTPEFASVIQSLQKQAGDDSPIYAQAKRLVMFKQQSRCGRIAFDLIQPASNKEWPAIGGALNICTDGLPPLQACPNHPTVLVPAGSRCRDGSAAQDTPEVAAAIQASLAAGGLTREQVRRQLEQALPASAPQSGSGKQP